MQVARPTPMDVARFLDVEAIVNEDGEDDDFESEDDYGACVSRPDGMTIVLVDLYSVQQNSSLMTTNATLVLNHTYTRGTLSIVGKRIAVPNFCKTSPSTSSAGTVQSQTYNAPLPTSSMIRLLVLCQRQKI